MKHQLTNDSYIHETSTHKW